MGKAQRQKGVTGEREAVALLREAGFTAERCLTETRDGNVGDITVNAPLAIQVKVGQRVPWLAAMREAKSAAREGEIPIAMLRQDRMGWYVMIPAKAGLAMLYAALTASEDGE